MLNNLAELFYWYNNSEHTRELNEHFFKSDTNIMYVAVENRKVIGSLYGYELERYDTRKKQLFIYSIDVVENYHRRGIGKKLIKAFISELKNDEYYNAFVITNKKNYAAVNLYKSTGAKQVITDDGDDILLKWI